METVVFRRWDLRGIYGICGSMISAIPAQPEPSNGACRWDKPTAMERYVHVASKSQVEAVPLFAQSHRNVDIPTPFGSKNGAETYELAA